MKNITIKFPRLSDPWSGNLIAAGAKVFSICLGMWLLGFFLDWFVRYIRFASGITPYQKHLPIFFVEDYIAYLIFCVLAFLFAIRPFLLGRKYWKSLLFFAILFTSITVGMGTVTRADGWQVFISGGWSSDLYFVTLYLFLQFLTLVSFEIFSKFGSQANLLGH